MRETVSQDVPWVVTFTPGDNLEEKLKKAAHVKPSPAQLAWMEKEYIAFVHYGPNTFNGTQWGSGKENVSDFCPSALNVSQWCRVCAQAGMKMIVFTAKHHDGFCHWHTKTTDFSVENSPIKEDIMTSLRAGCDSNQIGLGVYLSPWDMNQREKKLWGTEQYNEYFLRQLGELLTNYGHIEEVWFDGACGDFEIWKPVPAYTPSLWYDLIDKLQPSAVVRLYDPFIFAGEEEWQNIKDGNMRLKWRGKGVRWVGNEGGLSRQDEWSVQPVFDRQIAENATLQDLGEEKYYENAVGAIWYPLEVNTVILNQWFWNEKTSVARSLPDLIDVYYNSIGNNGVLLLNVSPNSQGIIGEDQVKRLTQLKTFLDNTFRDNLALNADVAATEMIPGHPPCNILDRKKDTYWTTKDTWILDSSTASLTIDLKCEKTFDNVMLQEFVSEGQRIAGWNLEVWVDNIWLEVVRHKTIGYKNIKRFKLTKTSKVRLNILRSWDKPMLNSFGLYLSDTLPETDERRTTPELALNPVTVDENILQCGLRYCSYEGGLQSAALLDSVFAVKYLKTGISPKASVACVDFRIGYSLSFSGYLRIPADGAYTFQIESADGSLLYLGDSLLLNNDEPHELKALARTMSLKQGYYPVKILYTSFRHSGMLKLRWQGPAFDIQEIGPDYFCCTKEN